jgi:hypothetical protein
VKHVKHLDFQALGLKPILRSRTLNFRLGSANNDIALHFSADVPGFWLPEGAVF